MLTRTLTAICLLTAIAAHASTAPAANAALAAKTAPRCADEHALIEEVGTARMAEAARCLINRERLTRGLKPLRASRALGAASAAHAADMVGVRSFTHDSSAGLTFVERILGTAYVNRRTKDVLLGANIGWGSGRLAAPGAIVRAWMRSPDNRANILKPAFRHLGLAVVAGTPSATAPLGATFTATFGMRVLS